MCNLAKFTANSASWLAEEQLNELLQLGNTTLVSLALGLSGLGFEDVLASKASSFSLLDGSKRAVLNTMQDDGGIDYIIALTMETQEQLVNEIDEIISDMQEKTDGLKQATQATPDYSKDKPSIAEAIDGLKKLFSGAQSVSDNPESAGEALQQLVNQGLITQESLDDYLQATPIVGRPDVINRRQVVNELRDRYYTVEGRTTASVIGREALTPQFKIVDDEGNEVTGVAGYSAGTLQTDGTIGLSGILEGTAQNQSKNLYIKPIQTSKRPTKLKPKLRVDISDITQNLQEELYYEVWACLILDIVQYLRNSWDRVIYKIDRLLDVLINQQSILRGTPFGPVLGSLEKKAFGKLNNIKNKVDKIIPLGYVTGDETLSIQDTLLKPGLPGGNSGRSICDFNHSQYCDIHQSLLDFINALDSDLDLLNLSLGGVDIGSLNFDLNALMDLIVPFILKLKDEAGVIDDLINKLQGDICAFAAKRMKGVPKNLSAIEQLMAGLKILIAAKPSLNPSDWGILKNATLSAEAAKLLKVGYVAASAALLAGDIIAFLAMDERDSTMSGQIAKCLEQAASTCGDATKSSRMRELAVAARARSDQKITGQRLIEGARRRRILNGASVITSNITKEALGLVTACAAERIG